MDIPLNAEAHCADGVCGRSTYVIVNPVNEQVTHVVVREEWFPHNEHLVPLDLVITVCGHADENCPAFLTKAKTVHIGFDDPPKLAKEAASNEAALDCYRRVRDEIRDFVRNQLPRTL